MKPHLADILDYEGVDFEAFLVREIRDPNAVDALRAMLKVVRAPSNVPAHTAIQRVMVESMIAFRHGIVLLQQYRGPQRCGRCNAPAGIDEPCPSGCDDEWFAEERAAAAGAGASSVLAAEHGEGVAAVVRGIEGGVR